MNTQAGASNRATARRKFNISDPRDVIGDGSFALVVTCTTPWKAFLFNRPDQRAKRKADLDRNGCALSGCKKAHFEKDLES